MKIIKMPTKSKFLKRDKHVKITNINYQGGNPTHFLSSTVFRPILFTIVFLSNSVFVYTSPTLFMIRIRTSLFTLPLKIVLSEKCPEKFYSGSPPPAQRGRAHPCTKYTKYSTYKTMPWSASGMQCHLCH